MFSLSALLGPPRGSVEKQSTHASYLFHSLLDNFYVSIIVVTKISLKILKQTYFGSPLTLKMKLGQIRIRLIEFILVAQLVTRLTGMKFDHLISVGLLNAFRFC